MSSKTDELTEGPAEPPEPPPAAEGGGTPGEPGPARPGQTVGTTLLRVVSALAFLVLPVVAVWATFDFMRDGDANRFLIVAVAVVVGVGGVFCLFYGMNRTVDLLPEKLGEGVRPYVFVGPALVLLSVFLVYPVINTLVLSFKDRTGDEFIGWDNYRFVFEDESMLRAIRNTALWIIVVPLFAVIIGLLFASLADRLRRGEAVAKSIIFLPMAISLAGATVTFGLIYSFRPEGFGTNIGLLNGLKEWLGHDSWFDQERASLLFGGLAALGTVIALVALANRLARGGQLAPATVAATVVGVVLGGAVTWLLVQWDLPATPTPWLQEKPWNNLLLMVIMIWMQTGFAMVVLSAAIKSVPDEIIEAARIDGASELQVFRRIVVPSILPTIVVVTTYMVINALKVFDIVFVSGNAETSETEVIAERMILLSFRRNQPGYGAAIAVILFLAVIPVMWWNIRRFRAEEAIR
jgi:alpha-glucoside transport system permease protein